jgi:sugar-specific transcriptional regulator TrmB/DNA-binding CsgD family transcriptional regulator
MMGVVRLRMAGEAMLEALGLSSVEEAVWQVLVDRPPATIGELCAEMSSGARAVGVAIGDLRAKGLVIQLAGRPARYTVTSPDIALDVLVRAKEEKLQRVRLLTEQVMRRYRSGRRANVPEDLVEVVRGADAVRQRCAQINRAAAREVCNLCCPPFLGEADPAQVETVGPGRSGRNVYDTSAVELPGRLAVMEELVRQGEQVRLAAVPVKLLLGDDNIGMIALQHPPTPDAALVVHSSSLLVALRGLFEAIWVSAVPLGTNGDGSERRQLLTYLAAGMTDKAIARQLGWHLSTVQRKVRRLMVELGVRTRFQAGLQAARRGWL